MRRSVLLVDLLYATEDDFRLFAFVPEIAWKTSKTGILEDV